MRNMSIVPLSQFSPVSQVPSIFASLFNDLEHSRQNYRPNANVTKEDNGFRIDLAVPGYDRDDIDITVKDETLTVEAKIEDGSQSNYRKEFTVDSFRRSWTLPGNTDIDGIDAAYKNGVLSLSIPSMKESHRKIKIG